MRSIDISLRCPYDGRRQDFFSITQCVLMFSERTESQNFIFNDLGTERLIEVGPSSTLLGMAKKVLDQCNLESDAARGIKRKLLSVGKDYRELCYNHEAIDEAERHVHTPPVLSEPTGKPAQHQTPLLSNTTPTADSTPLQELEAIVDAPLSAQESIRTLVASSLKSTLTEVGVQTSIRAVSGGRSTVQNEIMGDMLEEYGSLPEGAEDLPLLELAAAIQPTYDGKLKKCLRTRVARLFSTKMPALFDLTAARSHLRLEWGLDSGRQDAVLLSALTQQPKSRLDQASDAKAMIDGVAQKYMESNNLSIPVRTGGSSTTVENVDPKIVAELRREQSDIKRKIAALLGSAEDKTRSSQQTLLFKELLSQTNVARAKLDSFDAELGEEFLNGIQPKFQPDRTRFYDSAWNWAAVDLMEMYHGLLEQSGPPDVLWIKQTRKRFWNRWNDRTRKIRRQVLRSLSADQLLGAAHARSLLKSLEGVEDSLDEPNNITERAGAVIYGDTSYAPHSIRKCDLVDKEQHEQQRKISPLTELSTCITDTSENTSHFLPILRRSGMGWESDPKLSNKIGALSDSAESLLSFRDRTVLLTGAGPSSIGITLLPALLQGGAKVAVATSRPMSEAGVIYQDIYARYGGNGSQLVVLPCNQGSKQDVENMVLYIHDEGAGLGWDVDCIIPFAALTEKGREIDEIDSKAELAHRAMLTNVLRLLGAVKRQKKARRIVTRPALALLPLSPNSGTFGSDGLYSESKVALTTLFNRWSSESWSDYLSICGVLIGWTRGTGLMAANDVLASAVATRGVRTFSQQEMGDHILNLITSPIESASLECPLLADFSGGLSAVSGLASFTAETRESMRRDVELERALNKEMAMDVRAIYGEVGAEQLSAAPSIERRVNLDVQFPTLPDYVSEILPLSSSLSDMVDLESVVVVVGISELGPWGNSRTRWEMEAYGSFSPQGWIELAWMTGMIRYASSTKPSKDGNSFDWVDAETNEMIKERDVQSVYEKRIRECTGLRLVDPTPLDHPDRSKNQSLQEIVVEDDMHSFKASYDTAQDFVREHSDKVEIWQADEGDDWHVRLKKGAVVMIPKATVFDRIVGGQLPTGWSPEVYGLPSEICNAVDRCTLFALVCASEAFMSAGIIDVYELYKTIHFSELATCVGSGMGGGQSLHKLYRQRYLDRDVPNDILAETFINTTSAWLNMLLMSSSGPIRTPVGACATALEALNQGYDLIANGKAKFCLVGGFDDTTQATSAEFAHMKATNDSAADMRRGRAPHETSRPTASSRRGFVESEGCGMQLVTNAKLALELGLPIHAIVAHVQTASDGIGRSVPAPGKGIMSTVRSSNTTIPSPLLDISYRRRLLKHRVESIRESKILELGYLREIRRPSKPSACKQSWLRTTYDEAPPTPPDSDIDIDATPLDESPASAELNECIREVELAGAREEREARRRLGNTFWTHDNRVSPLRGALAVWNLGPDDISVASMHGTSTKMNEKNEAEVLHRQFEQLGRSGGYPAFAICQKHLTGHPKGAAAAWMLNGSCQIMDSNLIPGNRNADNIDSALRQWDNLVFPSRSVRVKEVKAVSVTSFGFGQKGAQALVVHPKYLFATIEEKQYKEYYGKRKKRHLKARQHFQNAFYGGKMVTIKSDLPYEKDQQIAALVNASARLQ